MDFLFRFFIVPELVCEAFRSPQTHSLLQTFKNNNALSFYRGRVALYAILKGMGIGKGDEVATQAFTCVAVPEGIMATGATPLYIDIELDGFNMDANDLRHKITSCTRAIIVQHTYGIPANMDSIIQVSKDTGLPIIEDCCHTLVSTYKGKTVGSFGIASFYSFEWGKPIVAGVGGSAMINNPTLLSKIQNEYANYGFPSVARQFRLELQYLGFKILYRPLFYWAVRSLYHLLSSLGVAEKNYNPIGEVAKDFSLRMSKSVQRRLAPKLQSLEMEVHHSRSIAAEYLSCINSKVVSHPSLPKNANIVFARYPMVTQNKLGVLAKARKANVELADWYSTPIHPVLEEDLHLIHYEAGSCPNAEMRCRQVVTLSTHSAVRKRDIHRAVCFLNEVSF